MASNAEALENKLQAARASILGTSAGAIGTAVNAAIGQFLPASFVTRSADIVDHEGTRVPALACIVCALPVGAEANSGDISADSVLVAIDVQETANIDCFRAAYRRVSAAKALKRRSLGAGSTDPNTIMGLVFAKTTPLPMEHFAAELEALNTVTPSGQWPDAVVFATTGVINYAVQFPGEKISGNWLVAKTGYAVGSPPPFYIPMVVSPVGDRAFDKMLMLVSGRVRGSTNAVMPEWDAIQAGIPSQVITWSGYQYNLRGELKPVPRDLYEDRSVPPPVLHIREKAKGNVLAGIQFLPWQDGAVILTIGKFPVDMLLVYFDRSVSAGASVFRRDGRQMSSVLPISPAEFTAALGRFQAQSNMVVSPDATRVVIQKVQDEGTSSPFIARIFVGLLYLRNLALDDKAARDEFDTLHEVMTSHLFNARDAARQLVATWSGHEEKVDGGACVRMEGSAIHITENVDRALRKEIDAYLNASVRALKEGVQRLVKYLNLDVGFLFMKKSTFEARIMELEVSDPVLATYLRHTRLWSERLVQSRIELEHGSWTLPRVAYSPNDAGVDAIEPTISGQRMTEFVSEMFQRTLRFAEEMTAHSIQKCLPPSITLTEIPVAERTAENPMRFLVTAKAGGLPPWRLVFQSGKFEDT